MHSYEVLSENLLGVDRCSGSVSAVHPDEIVIEDPDHYLE